MCHETNERSEELVRTQTLKEAEVKVLKEVLDYNVEMSQFEQFLFNFKTFLIKKYV